MGASVFFVMIPLYNVLCDALGINGKTSSVAYTATTAEVDTSREIQVQFITQNNSDMPWKFDPSATIVRVNPGALNDTYFIAKNITDQHMIGQAVPSVSPSRAAEYFHKTECFCFESQPLGANSTVEMPLRFIIDQDLPSDIKTVTLSYTLFDITPM
jgi:cytochrome c oxidase assembly protein subunit 11